MSNLVGNPKTCFLTTIVFCLQVVGNNNKINTGSKVRLQLFEPPSGVRRSPELVEVGNNNKINSGSKVRLQLFEPPSGVRRSPELVEVGNNNKINTGPR